MEEQQPEQVRRKRGRPRKRPEACDRQSEWKKRTDFEKSEKRKEYKRNWEKTRRKKKNGKEGEQS